MEIGDVTRSILRQMHHELIIAIIRRPYDQCQTEIQITQDIILEHQQIIKPALQIQFETVKQQFNDLSKEMQCLLGKRGIPPKSKNKD